jgi:hypothetical protein
VNDLSVRNHLASEVAAMSPPKMRSAERILQLKISDRLGAWRSKHADGVSGPLKTGLSNPKRISSRPNAVEVSIGVQTGNVITQLRRPRRAQELVASIREQPDIVGSFLAPNGKLKHQVLRRSRNL